MIIRVAERTRPYVTVETKTVEDKRLSFKATGLLVWLLAKPPHWTITTSGLASAKKEGRDSIATALKELEEHGYLVRNKVQDPATGQWGWVHDVYETPTTENPGSVADNPTPTTENPVSAEHGLPDVGKSVLLVSNQSANETKELKPSFASFADFWNLYPPRRGIKVEKQKAQEQWKKLSLDAQASAMTAVVNYADACKRDVTIAKDAFRWLRDKTFEDWQTPAPASKNGSVNDLWSNREGVIEGGF